MIVRKICRCLRDPLRLSVVLLRFKPWIFLPVDWKTKLQYRYATRRKLDFNNLRRFYEKIAWVKNRYHNPILHQCVDKYEVRKYVAGRIGEQYLIPVYGVYSSLDEIDFSVLPNQFVMKATHTSGNNLFCKDKSRFVTKKNLKKMKKWLKRDFWRVNGEWCYKDLPKRIICEKFLEAEEGEVPRDYKFYCFDGKPVYLEIIHERAVDMGDGVSEAAAPFETVYDMDWNLMEGWTIDGNYRFVNVKEKRPTCFEEMKEAAGKLSEGFPHVRVDLYEIRGHIFFGEMTFFSDSGYGFMRPDAADLLMGELLNLDEYKKFME